MRSASQFRPAPPPPLWSGRYAHDLREVARLGASTGSERTPAHDLIARWALEQSHFQLNRVARTETEHDGRSLIEHARLCALLGLAHADAITAVFDAKYAYRVWRPVTAIHHADVDGNRKTDADPAWTPFLTTPPHPEYPAAHGTVSGAGAQIMAAYFGHHYAFLGTSSGVPGEVRSFASFKAFELEPRWPASTAASLPDLDRGRAPAGTPDRGVDSRALPEAALVAAGRVRSVGGPIVLVSRRGARARRGRSPETVRHRTAAGALPS